MRRVRTASGATAVQIVHKRGRTVLEIEHIGSAHDEGQLAMLLETARARLNAASRCCRSRTARLAAGRSGSRWWRTRRR